MADAQGANTPGTPRSLDQHLERSSSASLEFESVNGWEPKAGDLLSFEDLARDRAVPFFAAFISAWNRKLPGLVCPLKLQKGELYFRTLGDGSGEVWQEKTEVGTQARWKIVEWDATGKEPGALEDMSTVPTVRFLGVVSCSHHCKPISEATTASGSSAGETLRRTESMGEDDLDAVLRGD